MPTTLYTPDNVQLLITIEAKKDCEKIVLETLYKSISLTHKEAGCLEYRVFSTQGSITVFGIWKNKMSLDLHLLLRFHLELFEETLPPLCEMISIKSYKELEPPITALSLG